MGIDQSGYNYGGSGYRGRGGYARGYGGWRGRGRGRGSMTWTPAMAAGGAAPASSPGAHRLDNRTTKIQVRDVTDEIKPLLQTHFATFGEVAALTFSDAGQTAVVQFRTRREAEQAAFRGSQLEGVGTLKMSWFNDPASTAMAPPAVTSPAPVSAGSMMDEDVDLESMENTERSWKR
ncbi:hypothetical protein THASP1DRAFT_30370 [Thamnocephalis sphaerospora]|uniref:RRM domain-containing protein n=1 Tax=Thamnocephalis sphaerospora TaxID=78915 RepID=A0A4P9XR71_9FUNG|nr:hypothetical protein THASP1DRAFT_30370 [Thamnocephalis sphaerospora]|eukprot:RKP07810.1 hypothetical protein THASP1DRAFT_30370 [Thamnocephalis sphaerospora]